MPLVRNNCVRHRQKILNLRLRSYSLLRLKMQSQSRRLLSRMITLAPGRVGLRRRPFACAIRSTASSSPRSHASYAAAGPPKHTTFALLNRVRSTARSATSTPSRFAGSTTANCTATAMKLHGGPQSTSIRCPSPLSYGDARADPPPRRLGILPEFRGRRARDSRGCRSVEDVGVR